MRGLAWAAVVVAPLGCGEPHETRAPPDPPLPPSACAAGEVDDIGGCRAAGLPSDMPCLPGELATRGGCKPAGIAPGDCGEGFVHDGDRGCEPLLPSSACAAGMLAVPGERACHAIAACASGRWGDIPVESDSQYVDASYDPTAGGPSDGTSDRPWTGIQAAIDAATDGAIVAIAAGSYTADLTLAGKAVRLWGVCPALVEITGTGIARLFIHAGANGTEVRHLALRGSGNGVDVSGSNVLVDSVWVHDIERGLSAQDDLGPTTLTIRNTLVDHVIDIGIFLWGADAIVEDSVIRDAAGGRGFEATFHPATGRGASLDLRRSVVERTSEFAVFVSGSDALVEGSVVRHTSSTAAGTFGRGVNVQSSPNGARSALTLRGSLIDDNREQGVFIAGADASIDTTVVRATRASQTGGAGKGIEIQSGSDARVSSVLVEENASHGVAVYGSVATLEATAMRECSDGLIAYVDADGMAAEVTLRGSLFEQNQGAGLVVSGSRATVEACAIRDTQPDASGAGYAVLAQAHAASLAPSTLQMETSLVEHSVAVGIAVLGSAATLSMSEVRDTVTTALGLGGHGLHVQHDPMTGVAASLEAESVLVERSREAGVLVVSADAVLVGCVVRDTMVNGADLFGDGAAVVAEFGPASLTIAATRIDRSARAALSSFGSFLALGGSELTCQAFDIDAEHYAERAPELDDRGGNACGCPDATQSCRRVSSGLAPPTPSPASP